MKSLPIALYATLGLGLLLLVDGCNDTDIAGPTAPLSLGAPVLEQEPEFTAGLENQITWSLDDPGAESFFIEAAEDPDFTTVTAQSDWTTDTGFLFTGLENGTTYFYRVKARGPDVNDSPWSTPVASTQDAAPPVTGIASTFNDQTSLRFKLLLQGSDELSGLTEIDLWFAVDGGEPEFYDTYAPGEITFLATGQGRYGFFTEGVDAVGNRADRSAEPQISTQVPEPIIITDATGEDFDITNAVLKHHIGVAFWDFGLGRNAIKPVINPRMIGPGEPGYPDDQNIATVIGVRMEDDVRAYKIGDIPNKEVVDDVVNGVPLAVTY